LNLGEKKSGEKGSLHFPLYRFKKESALVWKKKRRKLAHRDSRSLFLPSVFSLGEREGIRAQKAPAQKKRRVPENLIPNAGIGGGRGSVEKEGYSLGG